MFDRSMRPNHKSYNAFQSLRGWDSNPTAVSVYLKAVIKLSCYPACTWSSSCRKLIWDFSSRSFTSFSCCLSSDTLKVFWDTSFSSSFILFSNILCTYVKQSLAHTPYILEPGASTNWHNEHKLNLPTLSPLKPSRSCCLLLQWWVWIELPAVFAWSLPALPQASRWSPPDSSWSLAAFLRLPLPVTTWNTQKTCGMTNMIFNTY